MSNELKKQVKETAENEGVIALGKLFLHPAILMWMTPTFIHLFPVLAPLSVLGYWQWVGLYLIFNWVINGLQKILHG